MRLRPVVQAVSMAVGGIAAASGEPAWACGGLGLAAIILAGEARRDFDAFAGCVAVDAALATMLFAIFAADSQRYWQWAATGVLGAVTVAALWRVIATRRFRGDGLPTLADFGVPPDSVRELDGVQLALMYQSDRLELLIALQNCWDAPRKVEVDFDADGPFSLRKLGPAVEPVWRSLAPREIGFLAVPLPLDARWHGRIYVAPKVRGRGGRRVRRARATEFVGRVSKAFTILALMTGHLHWGGGLYLELGEGNAGDGGEPRWQHRWPA